MLYDHENVVNTIAAAAHVSVKRARRFVAIFVAHHDLLSAYHPAAPSGRVLIPLAMEPPKGER